MQSGRFRPDVEERQYSSDGIPVFPRFVNVDHHNTIQHKDSYFYLPLFRPKTATHHFVRSHGLFVHPPSGRDRAYALEYHTHYLLLCDVLSTFRVLFMPHFSTSCCADEPVFALDSPKIVPYSRMLLP